MADSLRDGPGERFSLRGRLGAYRLAGPGVESALEVLRLCEAEAKRYGDDTNCLTDAMHCLSDAADLLKDGAELAAEKLASLEG